MPRHVDHGEQRDEIADAVLRIAAREGLGGVTMSQVAVEAGVSKGRVQHYFASKHDLLLHTSRRLRERVATRVSGAATGSTPEAVLRTVLRQMLPGSERAREDSLAGHALFAVALGDPALRELYGQGLSELADLVTTLVRRASPDLSARPARRQAAALLGLVGYLGDQLLLGGIGERAARLLLDGQIGAVLNRS